MGRIFKPKVLGRKFEGDSLQCREMSPSVTEGRGRCWRNLFQKRSPQ